MSKNIKISKIIVLAVIVISIGAFATACAADEGFAAVTGAIGLGAPGPAEVNENDAIPENLEVIEDGELDYDHDAIFSTGDESAENDVADSDFPYYHFVTGAVESIASDTAHDMQVTIVDADGNPAVLIITGDTVYPFETEINVGDTVTAWYATNMPIIMIWPPQYDVAVLAVNAPSDSNITVDLFESMENYQPNEDSDMLLSQDQMFAFRVDEDTEITLADGTDFTGGDLEGRRIVVIYGMSTRSIPELATATRVIVLFEDTVPLG